MRASHLFLESRHGYQRRNRRQYLICQAMCLPFCLLALCRARICFSSCFSVGYLGTNRTKFRAYPVSGRQCQLFRLLYIEATPSDRMTPSDQPVNKDRTLGPFPIVFFSFVLVSISGLQVPLGTSGSYAGSFTKDSICGCMRCMQCSPPR